MLSILIDSDAQRRKEIAQSLSELNVEPVAAASLDELNVHGDQRTAGFALIQSDCTDIEKASTSAKELRPRATWIIAACGCGDCDVDWTEQGFDDAITGKVTRSQLRSKLEVARRVGDLQSQLAQAQKLESIGELAAGIAHEINTPIQYVGDNTRFIQEACEDLSEVLTCCQDLLTATEGTHPLGEQTKTLRDAVENADLEYLSEEIPNAIEQSLEGITRVTNIVRAMKEFAHPGAAEMTPIDLPRAIENTLMVARNEWKYVADLETDFDESLPLVPCLPGELNQVILNMVVNAAHAIGTRLGESPESKGRIKVSARTVGSHAELRISDSGTGIPEEHLDRIFRPFFTTKAAGRGTGQGLAIAHSVIVEKHGGTINVETELGVGTTFVICIPLVQETESQERDAAVSNAGVSNAGVSDTALVRNEG